jgi:protein-S-isoprenylcysteine O-methyltransferase Ste14
VAGLALNSAVVLWKNPELIAERWKRRKDTKRFDKVFGAIYLPAMIALPVVAGLDATRFGWAPLPSWTVWPGVLLVALSIPPVAWAMATNPHLEATVRIQHDRGHKVITIGPYAIVRHPMYVGGILSMAGAPLALGSAWAYVPAGCAALVFVIRTALEDRTLRRELPGYEQYARRTRYRLAPGVW